MKQSARWLGVVLALPLVLGGAAAAFAAPAQSGAGSFISDVARRLGVSEQKLVDAITQARLDRVRQLVRQGRITATQAAQMEQRINTGRMGRPGMHRWVHRRGGLMLSQAASYLGLTPQALLSRLAQGESPADIAKAQGKTPAGLEAALLEGVRQRIASDVKAGRLTQEQGRSMESRAAAHIHRFVVGGWPTDAGARAGTPPPA